jgi:lysophospholipase L1-like esterase
MHIAAIGSSFAAGPGIPPLLDRSAMRSRYNYAHILADNLGARLTDLTVSGATLDTILSQTQKTLWKSFAPQLSGLPSDANIVTITAGGNDLGYIGGVISNIVEKSTVGRLLYPMLSKFTHPAELTADEVAQRFVAVIDEVQRIAPAARILLVEYITIFGPHVQAGVDVQLTTAEIQHHREKALTLARGYRLASEARPRCELVPIADHSRDHGLGSQEPWVYSFSWGMLSQGCVFHPNLQGMQAVAKELEAVILARPLDS